MQILKENLQRALRSPVCKVPENYLVFDLETTGLEFRDGVIWQIGMHPVMGGKPLAEKGMSIFLDTPESTLRANTFEIKRRARAINEEYSPGEYAAAESGYIDEVRSQGVSRAEGFAAAIDMLSSYVSAGWPIVGQNLVHFDVPFFENDSLRHGTGFRFPYEGVIDVGVLIKSAKLQMRSIARENLREFTNRVSSIRAKGVYYAIERFCVPYWQLDTRFGVDLHKAHNAGYDCWITDLIFREMVQDAENGTVRFIQPGWGACTTSSTSAVKS